MYKGIYIATSGAILKQTQLEVISQNLANANTSGYKKDGITFQEYLFPQDAGQVPDGRAMSDLSSITTDLSNGTIIRTGNPLDIAIEGDGLLVLEGDRYTRQGNLRKDSQGFLTTQGGLKVLGAGGPIQIPDDSTEISIDNEGKVSVLQPGTTLPSEIDTIRVVEFAKDVALTKSGDGQLVANGPATPSTSGIQQGYIEMSNVDTIKEMVRMIDTMREFESYQKVIQMFDGAAAKVNNELGRL